MSVIRTRWAKHAWLLVVLAMSGCTAAKEEPTSADEAVSDGANQLFKDEVVTPPLQALTAQAHTAHLARFWAIDRFFLDGGAPVFVRKSLDAEVLAKASPDECFNGVGQPITYPDANGKCATGQPKVNDAYVWGLAKYGPKLFFGTLANTLCLVESGFLGVTAEQVTSEWVCEFGQTASQFKSDFRPPNMFMYDTTIADPTKALVSLDPTPLSTADRLRMATTGLRSAGTLPGSGVVFLAGPAAGRNKGVNVFALDSGTGALLGYFTLGNGSYNNVRMWVVAKGALYVGVGTATGGAVLRWTGDKANPDSFVEVGHLPGDAANMVFHDDGRIYITTWPAGDLPAGLFRSPVIPDAGLVAGDADKDDWKTPLWLATYDARFPDVPWYDPDTVSGRAVGGGAVASFKGRLYFGTMSVPFVAAQAAIEAYGLPPSDLLRTALGTHRSIALFEVKLPADKKVNVSMIFGEKYLPKYDAAAGGYTIAYDGEHRTGFVPRWGPSGAGNFFNTYTWSSAIFRGQVLFGTFDWSQLARVELMDLAAGQIVDPEVKAAFLAALGRGLPREGADLIRFSDSTVFAESVDGLGNNRNYGFRNMVTDGAKLWVGTANPMNLDPKGGWELIELK
jgi:hypothetical protein